MPISKAMKKFFVMIPLLFSSLFSLYALPILYAEHYYRLYHLNLHRYPIDYLENLVYLEQALKAPFVNPLNAIAKVETEKEYNYYQALFKMHCNLKVVETYRLLGAKWDKQKAYWFNAPFREINLDGLKKAEGLYQVAKLYWEEAKRWSKKASQYPYLELKEVQFWMDECWRIENGELDYGKYIEKDLNRIAQVRADYEAMDDETFLLFGGSTELNQFFDYRTIEQIKKDNDSKPYPPRKSRRIPQRD